MPLIVELKLIFAKSNCKEKKIFGLVYHKNAVFIHY